MKWISRIFATPELSGLICGGLVFGLHRLAASNVRPFTLLLFEALAAALAGVFCVLTFRRSGLPGITLVRRAGGAGMVAAVIFSLLLLFWLRSEVWFFSYQFFLPPLGCFMPAVMIGTVVSAMVFKLFVSHLTEGDRSTPQPLPNWCPLSVRLVMGGAVCWLLVAPWIPKTMVRTVEPKYTPPKDESLAPAVVTTPPRAVFQYITPPELLTTPPIGWKIVASRRLGNFDVSRGFSFSENEQWMAATSDERTIHIIDLNSDVMSTIQFPEPLAQFSLSPDGCRVFVVMKSNPRTIGVGFSSGQRLVVLPQPKKHAVPGGEAIWLRDKEVFFKNPDGNQLKLDLDSLEFDPAPQTTSDEKKRWERDSQPRLPKNDRWEFLPDASIVSAELPETEGTQQWNWTMRQVLTLRDAKHAAALQFESLEVETNDRWIGVSDGSKILRIRGGEVRVFYLGTKPVPPLRWNLTMPHGIDGLKESARASEALARKELVLFLYAPLINPLNNRTVGPDRQQPKAVFRISRWEGVTAEVWGSQWISDYTPGDVFADLNIPGSPRELLSLDQPHRWWTVAPEPLPDANDISKVPLNSDLLALYQPAPAAPPEPQASVPQTPTPEQLEQAMKREVLDFVMAHHTKASRGQIADLASDYAEQVDYLNKGMVGPQFILKDETDYHREYRSIQETVEPGMVIRPLKEGVVEVEYVMSSERVPRNATKARESGRYRLNLRLISQDDEWRIAWQRSTSQQ